MFIELGLPNSWYLCHIWMIIFSPGSHLWWPNTNECRIWYNWYMLEIISGWLCGGQINKKRCWTMILVEIVLHMMAGVKPTGFVEVRSRTWNAGWANIKQKKYLFSLACIKKCCYDSIHFTFAERGNESCGQQQLSGTRDPAKAKPQAESRISLQINLKQVLQACTSENKSFPHPNIKGKRGNAVQEEC